MTIEFLDSSNFMQPHLTPFMQNLGRLGIQANLRVVDAAQLKSRTEAFDFDVVTEALPGSTTPGVDLRVVFSSAAAAQNGSRNLAGVADPVVDALIEKIATAQSRDELNTAAARSTASCAPATIGSRIGIATPPGSLIGTPFPGLSASPSSAPARPAPGGGTKRRPRPLDSERRWTLRPAQTG